MRLSVVVITWNQRDVLARCLHSLVSSLDESCDEIVLVDNGSVDGTDRLVRERFPQVQYIPLPQNIGVGPARNIGIQRAHGQFVMTLDNDARILDGGAGLGTEVERVFGTSPDIGVLAFRLVYPDGRDQPNARRFPTMMQPFVARAASLRRFTALRLYHERMSYAGVDLHGGDAPADVDWVLGANQVFRRETALAVGAYDPRMFYGHEDCEFCLRVRRLGLRVVVTGAVTIEHDYHRRSTHSLRLFLRHTTAFMYMFWKEGSVWALRP